MKLWQLVSIMDDSRILQSLASSQEEWKNLELWFAEFGKLVQVQDRVKLDYELPESLVNLALSRSKKICFLSGDGWLRSWPMSADDQSLSALEVYKRYGGTILERVLENGVVATEATLGRNRPAD